MDKGETKSSSQLKSKPKYFFFIGLFVLVVVGVWFLNQSVATEKYTEAEIVTFSTSTPDETKPSNNYRWMGQFNDPKKITIPSVNIEGFIQNVGIDQNNEIAVPNNVFKAGWYTESVRPGDKGLSIIDGHVDGLNQDGAIFQSLSGVSVGDTVSIKFGDDSIKNFKVIDKSEVLTKDAPSILYSQKPNVERQVNLITCIGNYDQASKKYDKRIIVSLEQK